MEVQKYLIAPINEDYFIISVNQEDKVNRPNNAEDEDIINEYMENNFGSKSFEIIPLDNLEIVDL